MPPCSPLPTPRTWTGGEDAPCGGAPAPSQYPTTATTTILPEEEEDGGRLPGLLARRGAGPGRARRTRGRRRGPPGPHGAVPAGAGGGDVERVGPGAGPVARDGAGGGGGGAGGPRGGVPAGPGPAGRRDGAAGPGAGQRAAVRSLPCPGGAGWGETRPHLGAAPGPQHGSGRVLQQPSQSVPRTGSTRGTHALRAPEMAASNALAGPSNSLHCALASQHPCSHSVCRGAPSSSLWRGRSPRTVRRRSLALGSTRLQRTAAESEGRD